MVTRCGIGPDLRPTRRRRCVALERAQAKVVSAETEIGRLQSLVAAPNRPSARNGVGQ